MAGDVDLKQLHAQITGQPQIPDWWPSPCPSFDIRTPASHSQDPDTSKAVERSITDSGKRKSNNQRVAWLVARYPGCTASEYTELVMKQHRDLFSGFTSIDKLLIEIRRRLSDMNRIHVQRGTKDEAKLALLHNKESIWWPR